ncbi:hypothetical protein V6U89_24610 [Micromonospora sp. CPCC 206171]|uniref:hypothetical protein n=1 Tax=Micromonospora sp. CPCC 206171 TaxID=3122405 RepID=UPI002FF0927A
MEAAKKHRRAAYGRHVTTAGLRNAATAALRVPDVDPWPDQFVYSRSQEGPGIRESWMSVDGTRDGLVIETSATGRTESIVPGCRNGRAAVFKGDEVVPGRTERCTPAPAYCAYLPTDADAMRTFLIEHRQGEPGDANAAGKAQVKSCSSSTPRPTPFSAWAARRDRRPCLP